MLRAALGLGTSIGASPALAQDSARPGRTDAAGRFVLAVPDRALADLQRRLGATRWPERETVSDWSQGVPLERMRSLVEYWRTRYDWRRCEATLNRIGQFKIPVGGLGIHGLHARSPHPNALPIVLTHGWPGSVIEFVKVIAPLTDPTRHGGTAEDAFHVVAPSLPGFGFSDKPTGTGWNVARVAAAWAELMPRLGYTRYVAQGGDWGAGITTALAHLRPRELGAIHLNMPLVVPRDLPSSPTAEERSALDALGAFMTDGFGYGRQMATRPQTLGYGLVDSPVGQAAYIYEKFAAWTDSGGEPERVLTRDEMLDDIMLYWLGGTAASAGRTYWQNATSDFSPTGVVDLPVGCSIFPKEIYRPPRAWAERAYGRLIYWGQPARGGHFAAFEQPAIFVDELRRCFRSLR